MYPNPKLILWGIVALAILTRIARKHWPPHWLIRAIHAEPREWRERK